MITFIIPTLNAGDKLRNCLDSIRSQKFCQNQVHIVLADGGSTDDTLKIAKEFGCTVFFNHKKLAEEGIKLAMPYIRTEFVTIFASDNELILDNWIQAIVNLFYTDYNISAIWGGLIAKKTDPSINRYAMSIQSDPLTWFMNNNLLYYFSKCGDNFIIEVDPKRPLVWGANGLTYRTKDIRHIWQREGYLGDNDAFQLMIEHGDNKVVFTPFLPVYHNHVKSLFHWAGKWKRNFTKHYLSNKKSRNMKWVTGSSFKLRLIAWLIYVPFFSLPHSIYLAGRDKKLSWLWHSVCSFTQMVTYTMEYITWKINPKKI